MIEKDKIGYKANKLVEDELIDYIETSEGTDYYKTALDKIQRAANEYPLSSQKIFFLELIISGLSAKKLEHQKDCPQRAKNSICDWEENYDKAILFAETMKKQLVLQQASMTFDDKVKAIFQELIIKPDRSGTLEEILKTADIPYIQNDLDEYIQYFQKTGYINVKRITKDGRDIILNQSGIDFLVKKPNTERESTLKNNNNLKMIVENVINSEETLSNLISQGQLQKAIEYLLALDLSKTQKKEVLGIASSYNSLESAQARGVLSFEQETLERNRITNRLLNLVNHLSDEPKSPQPGKKPFKWWQYVISLGVVIGILGGLAEFSGISLSDLFGRTQAPETFTITVFVHGKKGKDERILKNQGQVMLGLRTNEMACSINEKGEATFKELPIGFVGQKVSLRIEHPQPYRATHTDSLYLLESNGVIYMEVALEGTDRITGKVMDFDTESWLDSVRVSIDNIATFTDPYGYFELFIPENRQRKFQKVSFFKKWYRIEELDSIPVHTQKPMEVDLHKFIKK